MTPRRCIVIAVAACALVVAGCSATDESTQVGSDVRGQASIPKGATPENADELKRDHRALGNAWRPASFSINVVTSNLVLRDKGLVSLASVREASRTTFEKTRAAQQRIQRIEPVTEAGGDVREMLLAAARHRLAALEALQQWAQPKARSSARLRRKRAQFNALWSESARQIRQATDVIQAARAAAHADGGAEDLFR